MKPVSISEQLMYNTVRLSSLDGSSGTGFFFNFNIEDKIVPVLITNKHVVNFNQNATMRFLLHLMNLDGDDSGENFEVTYTTTWIFHPIQDICFTFVNPLFEEVRNRTGKNVYYIANDESLVWDNDKLKELSALQEVTMVGYPNGLWDKLHNYPIFRKGFTAAHPGYDFNEKNIGLVDMACFPGSSGSPIYIIDEGRYSDKNGNIYFGKSRVIFLGILFSGPTMNVNGDIMVVDIPTTSKPIAQSRVMINLGYYIKSVELDEFKKMIEVILRGEENEQIIN